MVSGLRNGRMDHCNDLMKEGKVQMGKSRAAKPTRDQKAVIMAAGLNWSDWLVLLESDEELHIVSHGTGENRILKKPLRFGKTSQRHK